jgi:hypothetical protein
MRSHPSGISAVIRKKQPATTPKEQSDAHNYQENLNIYHLCSYMIAQLTISRTTTMSPAMALRNSSQGK